MELSGLIFVALALVWAVVLLPKALRHSDELARTRPVEGLSDGMRVLARREPVSEREARLVVGPPAVRKSTAAPAPAPAPVAPAPVSAPRLKARIAARRRAAAVAARRRRIILAVLVLTLVGVGVAAGLGRLPLWSVAVPAGLTLAFLVSARLLVRRERARWDAELGELERQAADPAPAADATGSSVVVADAAPATPVPGVVGQPEDESPAQAKDERGFAVVTGLDDTSSFPLGLLQQIEPTTDPGSLWDPLPVTLPTYVSKPRATRSVRTIDLNAPGVSSSGHDAASSALVAEAATSPPPDELPQQAVGS